MITPEQCSDIVRAYDAQGVHRTATDVDNSSAEWLVSEMRERGVEADLQSFPFIRVDNDDSWLSAGEWRIEGQPMPDGNLPPSGTVLTGTIKEAPARSHFALVRMDQHGQSPLLDRLRREPWQAIIAAVEGTPEGLTLRNAWHYDEPDGAPVVQVPAAAWEHLNDLKASGTPLQVACGATRVQAPAVNVVARVAGTEPALAPLVVLTPRSGWWHCAGERGGGLAIWLEVARCLAREPLRRDVMFLATTGHELGFIGIQRYLERDPALATRASLWIHLGANIGAANSPSVVRSAEPALLRAVEEIDQHVLGGSLAPEYQLTAQPPGGEALIVARAGGRYLSLVGRGFALFHSTQDRWPRGIDAASIALNGRMVVDLCSRVDAST